MGMGRRGGRREGGKRKGKRWNLGGMYSREFSGTALSAHGWFHPTAFLGDVTPFTDENTEALGGQEACPNDGGGPCAHHGKETALVPTSPPVRGKQMMRMQGGLMGSTGVWEPERT